MERSTDFIYPQQTSIRTYSAEDLIIFKAVASRVQDWLDIKGVIIKQSGQLDWG